MHSVRERLFVASVICMALLANQNPWAGSVAPLALCEEAPANPSDDVEETAAGEVIASAAPTYSSRRLRAAARQRALQTHFSDHGGSSRSVGKLSHLVRTCRNLDIPLRC